MGGLGKEDSEIIPQTLGSCLLVHAANDPASIPNLYLYRYVEPRLCNAFNLQRFRFPFSTLPVPNIVLEFEHWSR